MDSLQNQAIQKFRNGYNCAQAVITTFSGNYRIDENEALSFSCGFGAGMGRLQETCGAVTGSFMALGLHVCNKYAENKERKEKTYSLIREFDTRFKEIHHTVKCHELLNVDLKTPKGQKKFHDEQMHERICEKCIADSINIVNDLITS